MAEIRSLPSNAEYRANYERLFGKERLAVEKEEGHHQMICTHCKIAIDPSQMAVPMTSGKDGREFYFHQLCANAALSTSTLIGEYKCQPRQG